LPGLSNEPPFPDIAANIGAFGLASASIEGASMISFRPHPRMPGYLQVALGHQAMGNEPPGRLQRSSGAASMPEPPRALSQLDEKAAVHDASAGRIIHDPNSAHSHFGQTLLGVRGFQNPRKSSTAATIVANRCTPPNFQLFRRIRLDSISIWIS